MVFVWPRGALVWQNVFDSRMCFSILLANSVRIGSLSIDFSYLFWEITDWTFVASTLKAEASLKIVSLEGFFIYSE